MKPILLMLLVFLCACSNKKAENKTDDQKTSTQAATKQSQQLTSQSIFESNCVSCHGHDGTARIAGAANLQITNMNENTMIQTITNGKGGMPSFKGILSENDIKAVATFVKHLKK